ELREQRHAYLSGDRELKNAVVNVSHDLRTPLTAICGYVELMEREELSPDAGRYVAVIRERAEAMRSLCEELFRYSLVSSEDEQMHPEVLSLSAALQESFAAAYTMLKDRGITPEISLPETDVQRTLDRTALRRIFSNLLSNAAKYRDGDLHVTLSEQGTICFENTASALSETEVGRLFDRFFTVDSARKSTGLGLAISRTLTERMGGSISASLNEGRLKIELSFPE
ncbi:MAG: HAMP domain-containing histidine kinase, partial [Oscillospiraceae bacterium]|nr:HAMP domain-containing histidine kinase [Oscillospiraceae bacterium]